MVIDTAEESELPRGKLRRVDEVLDDTPLLKESQLWLLKFTASYYHHPIGEVVAAALPAALRGGRPLESPITRVSVSEAGQALDLEALLKRAPRQAEVVLALKNHGPMAASELDELASGWRRVRKALLDKSLIEEKLVTGEVTHADSPALRDTSPAVVLNADQRAALQHIRDGSGFRVHLLDGVTGSGKTEVYLRLIEDCMTSGKQTLVLVPEIGLTPQLVNRFYERLGIQPALYHSGLTDTERLATWKSAMRGEAAVIVGTRSSVFMPLQKPGLIVVDEEHDASLKQQDGLRYSARDLAVVRGKQMEIPVVLGSATPSLESLRRCQDGGYRREVLPARAGHAVPPLLRLVDLNRQAAQEGLSESVIAAIKKHSADGGQSLVFINRRGFAPTLICAQCGKIAECNRCDARMTVHATDNRLMCHHCGATRAIDESCPDCGSPCRPLGHGTERIEDALRAAFPAQSITRIDSDTTRLKGTMTKALADATSGRTQILVGTQMLSKGHHFPNLTLVVVINADQGLFSTDFRGSERLAQSLVQVAGRAGREKRQGEVIVQTAFPQHPFWNNLFSGGYEKFAQMALSERRSVAWPPFARLVLVRAAASRRQDARAFLDGAQALAEKIDSVNVRILGPVAAPMERKAGRFHAQLLLQCQDRKPLHNLLKSLRPALEADPSARKVRWSIDVDPIELF